MDMMSPHSFYVRQSWKAHPVFNLQKKEKKTARIKKKKRYGQNTYVLLQACYDMSILKTGIKFTNEFECLFFHLLYI